MSTIIGAETTTKVEAQPRGKMIAYWTVTLLLAAAVMLSGVGQLDVIGGKHRVSDESWLPIIRIDYSWDLESAWSIAVVVPNFPRLKEWVHAGSLTT